MKKFLIKIFLFASILIVGVLSMMFFLEDIPPPQKNFIYLNLKHDRIHQINAPKIIVTGGSNVYVGIDSKAIEEAFSVPVVNLGIHAFLGLSFILEQLKQSLHKQDMVILPIIYFLELEGSYELKKAAGHYYRGAKNFYPTNYALELELFFEDIHQKFKNLINGYSPPNPKFPPDGQKLINEYGDYLAYIDKEKKDSLKGGEIYAYRLWEGIQAINDFNEYAQTLDVKVFFVFPNYPASFFELNKEVIKKLESDINQYLQSEILNTPQDFVFPDDYFYDTVFHLNGKGRQIRTQKLIELIKKHPIANQSIQKMKEVR